MGKGSGRSKRRSGDRKVSAKASARGSVASVIRMPGIGDQNVCLSPRALAFSPLFEARKDRAHPRLPWPLRQTRPQSHVECSQAHIQQCAWGPPSDAGILGRYGSLTGLWRPSESRSAYPARETQEVLAASRCSTWPWHRTGALVPSRPHPRLAAPATPSQSGRGPLADAGPLDIPQSPR